MERGGRRRRGRYRLVKCCMRKAALCSWQADLILPPHHNKSCGSSNKLSWCWEKKGRMCFCRKYPPLFPNKIWNFQIKFGNNRKGLILKPWFAQRASVKMQRFSCFLFLSTCHVYIWHCKELTYERPNCISSEKIFFYTCFCTMSVCCQHRFEAFMGRQGRFSVIHFSSSGFKFCLLVKDSDEL